MKERKENHTDRELEQAMILDEMVVWNGPRNQIKPEDEAKRDFAESWEKHRKALEEVLRDIVVKIEKNDKSDARGAA
jgi:hypothetical protein